VSEEETKNVVAYLKEQIEAQGLDSINFDEKSGGTGDSFISMLQGNDGDDDDDLYEDAKQAVIEAGKASTSYIQRKLRVGYSRAARLMDLLEEKGVIGPPMVPNRAKYLPPVTWAVTMMTRREKVRTVTEVSSNPLWRLFLSLAIPSVRLSKVR
jgi:S-DNA-T family DNA segregation ATPase FtsK/SpoIIIE